MKTKAVLSQAEIRDAIKRYVESETGGRVVENGIIIRMTPTSSGTPCQFSADVEYEGSKPC